MKIPFMSRSVLALNPDENGFRWACISNSITNRLKIDTGRITIVEKDARSHFEPQISLAGREVVLGLNPAFVKYCIIQGPVVHSVESFDLWLASELPDLLPEDAKLEDFISRCNVLCQDEDTVTCMIALVRKNYVEQELSRLQLAGIKPDSVSGFYDDLELLFRQDAIGIEYSYFILPEAEVSYCLCYEQGICSELRTIIGLEGGARVDWQSALIDRIADLHINQGRATLFVAADEDLIHQLQASNSGLKGINCRHWQWRLQNTLIEPEWVSTCALAWAYLERGSALNFLSDEQVSVQHSQHEKEKAFKLVKISGCTLALTLALLVGGQHEFVKRLLLSEQKLKGMDKHVQLLDETRKRIAKIENRLIETEKFIDERTSVARILEKLTRNISHGVWIDELNVANESGASWQILINGASIDDRDLTQLLGHLEQLEFARSVDMKSTELIRSDQLYKIEHVKDEWIVRFDIVIDWSYNNRLIAEVG